MAVLKKERVPCSAIDDKYIDALLDKCSPLLPLELALLVIITRLEKIPPVSELSTMIKHCTIDIECALRQLTKIGFLSLT